MATANQEDELTMSTDEFLEAQAELYHHCIAFVKSLTLKAATDLGIADAIHRRGGATTLSDLAAETGIHPTKLSNLRRIMRVLTTSGIFSVQHSDVVSDDDAVYKLTRVSRLLVKSSSYPLSPVVPVLVDPFAWSALLKMPEWLATDERASLFDLAHGCPLWDTTVEDGGLFKDGMAADSRVAMQVLLARCGGVFEAVRESLVDVGGSHGTTAAAVANAFPHIKCTVLDLPDVVAGAPANDAALTFVAGDMFEYIPQADAILLKWILHDWKDGDCIKILRRCKEAIPSRDAGGKVIIIETVVGSGSPGAQKIFPKEAQVLMDVFMMYIDGIEREEHEWSKIFFEAGFSDYKITPTNGVLSVIEVYP
uniref:acetylserotonin O-methyltransferase n=1 Tax=Secale cereale TaxID=4550 RepID=A0A385HVS3_SECCE|nr:O-methyltransferase [Secale cereale]